MKNRINILFIFLLPIFILVIFAFPKTTFASWWNPFSWFKKEVKVEQQISVPIIQTETIVTSDNKTQKDIKEEKKTVSVIKPKKIIQEPPVAKQEVEVKKEIVPLTKTVKENYKLEDVVKEWRPYTVRVTCITLYANGNKKSYSDGSGFLAYDPARGPSVITNKHVFYAKDGVSNNYCDIYFPENKEVVKVEKKDRFVSSKGYDRGTLVITQPSEYVSNIAKNPIAISKDCKNTKPDSTDDIVILGYPIGKPKDDISYAQGKIVGYQDKYFVSTATIVSGYSGGVAVSLKDNCYLGIPTYSQKDDLSKSLILDINKF